MPILGCLDFLKGSATLGFQILRAGGITGAPPNALVLSEWDGVPRDGQNSAMLRKVGEDYPRLTPQEAFFKRAPFFDPRLGGINGAPQMR